MKRLICCLLFLGCVNTAFPQVQGDYSYSVGLRGYSIVQMPKILNQTNAQTYEHVYLNGLIIKFNDNQINYRINANYYRKPLSFYNSCTNCELAKGYNTDYSFKIGFEKNINYAKIQPYFGSDIGFRTNNFTGEVKSTNTKANATAYNVDADKTGFMISPIMGIKFTPVKQISLFAETSVDFYYSYERQEIIYQDVANTRTQTNYNKWQFLLNPMSFGILIHLIDKN